MQARPNIKQPQVDYGKMQHGLARKKQPQVVN
jgi:hypothetical protein